MIAINRDFQRLYFNTATMGLMSPTACEASSDLNRLASSTGCGQEIGRLISKGFSSLSAADQNLYPSLATWEGLSSFQAELRRLVKLENDLPVYLFNDRKSRLKLALDCLFKKCKRILITDLLWTDYQHQIRKAADERGVEVVSCCFRPIFDQTTVGPELIRNHIVSMFQQNRCDGLLISDVTYMGCVLPVSEIVSQLRKFEDGVFVVVDGAQALGHVPVDTGKLDCDLYLTCTQKWLGSYIPLRVVYGCRSQSVDLVTSTNRQLLNSEHGDALNEFCCMASRGCFKRYGEAISLDGLFAACGAIHDYNIQFESAENKLSILKANSEIVLSALQPKYAPTYSTNENLNAGILSVKTEGNAGILIERLANNGISAKNFAGNIRLSMPSYPITNGQTELIKEAMLVR